VRGRKRLPLVVALVCATTISGCGHTRVVGSDRTLAVGVTEYRLFPASVRVHAGELTILVHNYGRVAHNLVVLSHGGWAGATKPIFPGDTAPLTLVLTPGTYSMKSDLSSDEALGTYGTLVVTS
jgi:plastocyanin